MHPVTGAAALAAKATPPSAQPRPAAPPAAAPEKAAVVPSLPGAVARPVLPPTVRAMMHSPGGGTPAEAGSMTSARIIAQLIDALRAYEAGAKL